jgi:hypothetical protein
MPEYIKFRLTAAKVGVSMALAALVGGLAEKLGSAPPTVRASRASFNGFLKLDGIKGETKTSFLKLEGRFLKLDSALTTVEHKLAKNFYLKHTVDTTFLKIKDASAQFLKLTDANTQFLKLIDANASFLKITDANNQFLKLGGTAANSSQLGGLTPDAFVQGHANVVSGAASINDGTSQPLMQTPDGVITVSVSVDGSGAQSLVIHNGSATDLTAVFDPTAVERTLPAGQDFSFALGNRAAPGSVPTFSPTMTHVQIFPGGALRDVLTVTVSTEMPVNGANQVVGQMLIGLL